MHKCIQNNHINVILYRYIQLACCCCCGCYGCCYFTFYSTYIQFGTAMTDNACSCGIDEFIAIQQSTTQVMTNIQCILSTSSYSLRSTIFNTIDTYADNIHETRLSFSSIMPYAVCVCFSIFVLSILLAFSIFYFYRCNFHAFLFAFQSSNPIHWEWETENKKVSCIYSCSLYVCRHNFWHLSQ